MNAKNPTYMNGVPVLLNHQSQFYERHLPVDNVAKSHVYERKNPTFMNATPVEAPLVFRGRPAPGRVNDLIV